MYNIITGVCTPCTSCAELSVLVADSIACSARLAVLAASRRSGADMLEGGCRASIP